MTSDLKSATMNTLVSMCMCILSPTSHVSLASKGLHELNDMYINRRFTMH